MKVVAGFPARLPRPTISKSEMDRPRPTRLAIAVMVGALLLTLAVGDLGRAPSPTGT